MESNKANRWRKITSTFRSQAVLQALAIIGVLYLLVFCYVPMIGIIIAFKDYHLSSGLPGFFTSKWVGLKWFVELFNDMNFLPIIRNTVCISILKLIFTFPIPILFALTLNEISNQKGKKIVQTVSYMPHFISWVVVSGILFSFLNQQNGLINQMLVNTGIINNPVSFLAEPDYFWGMLVISDIWKEMGWWTILFLAAITGIDPVLYEAAIVDGAGRWQRIVRITLPSIKSTIIVILVLSLGNLFGGGLGGSNFDQCYLLGNSVNINVSEILQTYSLKMGLAQGRYSFAAAVGLLQSLISLLLVYVSNLLAKKLSGTGLF
jgi:putative aldouronate transport system permease protein